MTTAADLVGYWRARAEKLEAECVALSGALSAAVEDYNAEKRENRKLAAALADVCGALMDAGDVPIEDGDYAGAVRGLTAQRDAARQQPPAPAERERIALVIARELRARGLIVYAPEPVMTERVEQVVAAIIRAAFDAAAEGGER